MVTLLKFAIHKEFIAILRANIHGLPTLVGVVVGVVTFFDSIFKGNGYGCKHSGVHSLLYVVYTCVWDLNIRGDIYLAKMIIR